MARHLTFSLRRIAAVLLLCFAAALVARADEVMPPAPKLYFNDYAGVTHGDTARRLNAALTQFERDTSNQIVVAVFPKMQTDSSIEDYTFRIAQSWHVGQKGRNNGAVLFVFVQDRKMYIQVGYGLEGVLTDYLCHQIIETDLKPHFKNGDFDGGLTAGVNSMMAAARGEYKGTGRTVAEQHQQQYPQPQSHDSGIGMFFFIFLFFGLFIFLKIVGAISGRGGGGGFGGGPIIFGGGGGSSDSGFSGGGFSGGGFSGGGFSGGGDGGGGGFSGGGGDFGGGGAGGSW